MGNQSICVTRFIVICSLLWLPGPEPAASLRWACTDRQSGLERWVLMLWRLDGLLWGSERVIAENDPENELLVIWIHGWGSGLPGTTLCAQRCVRFFLVGLSFAEIGCSVVFVSPPRSIHLHFNPISSLSSPPSYCPLWSFSPQSFEK